MAEVIAYHVDRSAALVAGTVLDVRQSPSMPADVPQLDQEWPGGLTSHGIQYATSMQFNGETVSEWLFELVRRAEFPQARSRFQSVFAMASLADARAFRHAIGGVLSVPIFRVRGELAHQANMNLIRSTAPAVSGLARAREYWAGQPGLAAPLWETLLVPPVTVIERVEETEQA
jgi:hypothetical protein